MARQSRPSRRNTPKLEDIRSFESPESSNIARATYNADTWSLTIEFKTGVSYRYGEFPPQLWVDFDQAESKGQFFAKHIRPWFKGTKL